ncbi:MAG: hypothetical protein M3Q42_12930 [Pseudomonadota bacterium]|nr:hypothetical protein [Pseudomonadota bacterium]
MNDRFGQEPSLSLAARVEAAQADPSAAAVEQAQQALLHRLRSTPAARGRTVRGPWIAAATTAMLALVAVVAIPLLSNGGHAFAAVQQHFLDFKTLSMRVEQRFGGRTLQTSRMVVDAEGVMRTDVGEQLSVIVDPGRGRVLTLLHGPRRATLMSLERAKRSNEASLEWLEELRRFRGEADLLPGTRVIDGVVARGWSLQVDGNPMVLWADPSGLPLAMQMGPPGGKELAFRFQFDQPLPRNHLSSEVPAGYALAEPQPH